ncbi:hypothetical protein JVX92_00750 [Microbacterium hominis]|uniref:hypothetical protein n=1 Tax=Microbacterium hominis TaxID=162426 RepID=UPI0019626809|nr:hypothetical protein [Microbacterium hominis]QRY40857.1 hypothetical protein JVX92_00750 [Microbacterium hominis]
MTNSNIDPDLDARVTPAEVFEAAIYSLEAGRVEYALSLLRDALFLADEGVL